MGTELLIGLALAFVVLGPQRMTRCWANWGRAKVQLEKASQETREQVAGQLEDSARDTRP